MILLKTEAWSCSSKIEEHFHEDYLQFSKDVVVEQKCRRDVIKILSSIKLNFPSKRILLYPRTSTCGSLGTMVVTGSSSCRCTRIEHLGNLNNEEINPKPSAQWSQWKPHLRIQDFTLLYQYNTFRDVRRTLFLEAQIL